MPPIDPFVISDDEELDPQQTLSRDLASLDEEIRKTSEIVKELDAEVVSFTRLLKAAQNRLQKAGEQKERLIDSKQKLLDKKLRFLQFDSVARSARNPVDLRSREISTKHERPPAANVAEIDQNIKTSLRSDSSSRKVLSSYPAPTLVPRLAQESPLLPLSLDDETSPLTSDYGIESQYPSRTVSSPPGASPVADYVTKPSKEPHHSHTTVLGDDSQSRSRSKNDKSRRGIRRGRGSRRFYGGGLSGVRLGASICSRISSEQDSEEEQPQKTRGKKSRAIIYSPYWEASDSEPESGNNLGRKSQSLAKTALATPLLPQNIPPNPETHSRIEISSVIGGKTQGTWCSINPNKTTVYNAGPYMALDRGLNHLLPENPGENGGVHVADWLRKEVGKSYQVFIKKASNNWLLYGKYLVAAIREVSLDEWQSFDDNDKNRWAEHLLEHQWGKNILLKKKLLTESQCTKTNWVKVLSFFNRHDRPYLRLKVLELQFISYDRGLYNALVSGPSAERENKRKRYSPEYDGDGNDIWDEYPLR